MLVDGCQDHRSFVHNGRPSDINDLALDARRISALIVQPHLIPERRYHQQQF